MTQATRKPGKAGWRGLLCAAMLCLGTGSAQALPVDLSFSIVAPTPGVLEVGSSIFVEVLVSGLADGMAPSLTAIELDISFDDAVLDFVSLAFTSYVGVDITNGLGQPCTLENLDGVCDVLLDSSSSTGLVELAVASLVAPVDVNAGQPASGSVALIEFLAHTPGTTSLTFSQIDLSGTISGVTQHVLASSPSSTVLSVLPEPSASWLLVGGLILLGGFRGRR